MHKLISRSELSYYTHHWRYCLCMPKLDTAKISFVLETTLLSRLVSINTFSHALEPPLFP
jgi:hypothetical protein